jgi:MFS family permease
VPAPSPTTISGTASLGVVEREHRLSGLDTYERQEEQAIPQAEARTSRSWLSRVFSTHWLFAASAAGFTIASLLCATTTDIESMIAFRALQGFLGGSMIPMVFTSAFFFFQGQQRVTAAAIVGGLASLAPTLGPVVGGFITDVWSWQ